MENSGDMEEITSQALSRREEEVLIPSTACVWVMLFYLTLGTVMFAEWEQWNYLDSLYFCVTSLFKVGQTLQVKWRKAIRDTRNHLHNLHMYQLLISETQQTQSVLHVTDSTRTDREMLLIYWEITSLGGDVRTSEWRVLSSWELFTCYYNSVPVPATRVMSYDAELGLNKTRSETPELRQELFIDKTL